MDLLHVLQCSWVLDPLQVVVLSVASAVFPVTYFLPSISLLRFLHTAENSSIFICGVSDGLLTTFRLAVSSMTVERPSDHQSVCDESTSDTF